MSSETNSETKATILVIDDTPANLSLLNQLLRTHYRVKLANSGAKGLVLAESAAPDLILLDIMMPEIDGYEVFRQLKANPATAAIPIIFLTAKSGPMTKSVVWRWGGGFHSQADCPDRGSGLGAHALADTQLAEFPGGQECLAAAGSRATGR